jgi:hypothetical protein
MSGNSASEGRLKRIFVRGKKFWFPSFGLLQLQGSQGEHFGAGAIE